MKVPRYATLAIAITFCAVSQEHPAPDKHAGSDKDRLIGAWRLARIEAPGPDGKSMPIVQPKGMLIYTRDGHIAVQLMYSAPAAAPSNEYVQDGYEASFGSYDVNEETRTVTHHVQGSITRDLLVGKDLPRLYQFSENGRLLIKPSRPDEHWTVTWEHY